MTTEATPFSLDVQTADGTAVARFKGKRIHLGDQNSILLREMLAIHAAAPAVRSLVVDFRNVASVSSTTLAVLVALHKSLGENGKRVAICNVDEQIHEVFVITQLHNYLNIQRAGDVIPPAADGVLVPEAD